jgi:putative transposase
MNCKTYELKVDKSHTSKQTLASLQRLFLEAKWFYNDMVARSRSGEDFFEADYKRTHVSVKNAQGAFEERELKLLSSQMRQEIMDRTRHNLVTLHKLKMSGMRIGALRFKSRVNSIPLKQYGKTFDVIDDRIRIEHLARPLKVRGLGQIPTTMKTEPTNSLLIQRHDDYFVHLTVYQELETRCFQHQAVGVDAGIRHQLTLSNGLQIDFDEHVTKKLRKLNRELSRRTPRSNNWFRTRTKLRKEHNRLCNKRADIGNKIVSRLASTYETIAIQNDRVSTWQRLWGRQVLATAIGGIMGGLKTKPHTPLVLGRFQATTRECSRCRAMNEIRLGDSDYRCSACGLRIDRDLNAAINHWKAVPAERREFTPVDTKTATELMVYFDSIPGVTASLVEEAGSLSTLS